MVSADLVRGVAKSNLRSLGKKKVGGVEHETFLSPYGTEVSVSHDDTYEQLLARLCPPEPAPVCEVHDDLADCEAANFTCSAERDSHSWHSPRLAWSKETKGKEERHAQNRFKNWINTKRGKGINEQRAHEMRVVCVLEQTPSVVALNRSWEKYIADRAKFLQDFPSAD